MKIKKLCLLGLFTALGLVLSVLEQQLPGLPFLPPGVKLGLSNIAVMYTLFFLGFPEGLVLAVIKALFVLLTRGLMAGSLSLAGGVLSVLLMAALTRTKASYVVISAVGGIAHNIGQLLVACLWLGTGFFSYYVPLLILSGTAAGALTGLALTVLLPALRRIPFAKEWLE